uniref:G-protein coupled receptors family 1 profile domain-containing protein n=1 Tax=Aquila chrysaetos chrysaetos TaxID=223781 RepID=A0A663E765_AQUCH
MPGAAPRGCRHPPPPLPDAGPRTVPEPRARARAPPGGWRRPSAWGPAGSPAFCSNLPVLLLFWRRRAPRSPVNLLLLNIALSDLLARAPGTPLGLAPPPPPPPPPGGPTSPNTNVCFDAGIVSLISLAVLSYERYCTMTGMTEANTTNYRKTWTGIILSWTYSLVWTAPPPLFGWSSYKPEEPGTMCSMNWHSKDANNVSYIICLFIFCLVIPFVIIVYSYGKLLCAIRQLSGINKGMGRTRDQRILVMVVVMVICFLLCWLPYATVALIATFGKPGLITPAASIIPSILVKSSTVYNLIIYVFLNKRVSRMLSLCLLRFSSGVLEAG